MSWCDKLGSTPGIGYHLVWHSLPSDTLLNAMSPIVDRMVDGDEQRFSIDLKDALKLTLTSFDGYQYGFEPTRVYLGFVHRARVRTVSGGLPTLVLSSKTLPYTDLLNELELELLNTMEIVNQLSPRRLSGIGVVSTTVTDRAELPPGIERFLAHASKPWNGELEALTFVAQALLKENDDHSSRCVHTLVKSQKDNEPLQIVFDYQRIYKKPQDIESNRLRAATEGLKREALDYFEQLAQGDRFDEPHDGAASA